MGHRTEIGIGTKISVILSLSKDQFRFPQLGGAAELILRQVQDDGWDAILFHMIESQQDVAGTEPGKPVPEVRTLGQFPTWKRGVAILWVLSLCGFCGLVGLFFASFFFSFSGY